MTAQSTNFGTISPVTTLPQIPYQPPGMLPSLLQNATSIADVKAQVTLIQQIMREVMKAGEHYGVIPGCGDKPALLKPGAEKLMLTFRLSNDVDIQCVDLPNCHREYRVKVTLYSPTGQRLGTGIGSCSTMESKYRFRTGPTELTGQEVPKGYWDIRKEDPVKAQELIGGKGFATKKGDDKKWYITRQGEKVEHDNPADYYNTCLKMSKKRGLVDAVLTSTAASDIFTQDIDEDPELHGYRNNSNGQKITTISLLQTEQIIAKIKEVNADEAQFLAYIGFETLAHIPESEFDKVMKLLEAKKQAHEKQHSQNKQSSQDHQQELPTENIPGSITKRTINDMISMLAIKSIEMSLSADGSVINAKSFNEKDFLKQNGFKWSADSKSWTWTEA